MIPPPTAVVTARTTTPRISMDFFMARIAPEKAKAMTPRVSKTRMTLPRFVYFPPSQILLAITII